MLSYQIHPATESAQASGAPHLLLAHGALSNSAQWALNLGPLQGFCTPVTVELLGHGDSPSPSGTPAYEADAYVDYFETIRQQLGIERWFLCGYSLGAGLTMRYALRYPQQVYGHLFTNSRSAFADTEQMAKWAAVGQKTIERSESMGLKYLEKQPFHPRFSTSLPKAVYTPLVARSKLLNPAGASKTLAVTAATAGMRESIKNNTRPALLLQGVREKGFRPEADFARKHMPKLESIEIDAGHGVNMQAAECFNQAVEEFVRTWAT